MKGKKFKASQELFHNSKYANKNLFVPLNNIYIVNIHKIVAILPCASANANSYKY